MIYELRTYTPITGAADPYLKLFREIGLQVRGDKYGRHVGTWKTEFGTVEQVVHLWSYADMTERDLLKDAVRVREPRWMGEYVPSIRTLMHPEQQSQIFRPIDGVPLTPPPGDNGHVYELRTYQLNAAQAPVWARRFKEVLPVRTKYSPLVALWISDLGDLNQAYHLWAYDSLDQRMAARAAAAADPEWQAFELESAEMVVRRHSSILLPDPCSPLR
ncbi:MAG: NIPSNAP family protein [Chloroflexota bacterium]